ncbi:riboflavin kinase [Mycolicibacterium neoaurum]|nr:riboflavin kinase [Mycolicibacterium neoaurum VKM Ac-1815D]AMO05690.1 riboflavin kinase [Mycolicibacterium neoaurum]KJQ49461.1 riboflavin kinase [Mycolicibacterium neoaurum]KUM09098.1 bifunctional riboflavin kinase/FMN adenylyltransferase [Mycolicibacterium neoaurum]
MTPRRRLAAVQRWRGREDIPTDWGRCVLTIGVFDGVHRGHAELINRAVKSGRSRGVPTVLMTFDPHPMEVVFPGSHPAQLTTLARRAELVEETGVDVFLVMPFTADFMKLTPERYIHELLVESLHVVDVVVGENFTFGRKAAGNVDLLRKAGERFGFAVEGMRLVSEEFARDESVTFSSTYIRSCVDAGDVVAAAEALGRPHRVEGVVVRGDGRGRGLGFPTANVAPPMHSAIPADGVYAAWFTVLGHGPVVGTVTPGERYQAAVSVGTNPTFSGRTRTVEAFVLDAEADLYGQHVAVDFIARIRGQEKFDSVEDLVLQMGADTERARSILAAG